MTTELDPLTHFTAEQLQHLAALRRRAEDQAAADNTVDPASLSIEEATALTARRWRDAGIDDDIAGCMMFRGLLDAGHDDAQVRTIFRDVGIRWRPKADPDRWVAVVTADMVATGYFEAAAVGAVLDLADVEGMVTVLANEFAAVGIADGRSRRG